jgi:hypothetical protein
MIGQLGQHEVAYNLECVKFDLILLVTHPQFSTRRFLMPPYDPDLQTELQPTNNIQAERIRR